MGHNVRIEKDTWEKGFAFVKYCVARFSYCASTAWLCNSLVFYVTFWHNILTSRARQKDKNVWIRALNERVEPILVLVF